MQVTIPSPPEYTFIARTITADTSIGKIMISDHNGDVSLTLLLDDTTNRMVIIPASASNVITISTTKSMTRR